jgi:hypothetical protein
LFSPKLSIYATNTIDNKASSIRWYYGCTAATALYWCIQSVGSCLKSIYTFNELSTHRQEEELARKFSHQLGNNVSVLSLFNKREAAVKVIELKRYIDTEESSMLPKVILMEQCGQ